ncbi:pilus assembly protein PilZ [Oceanospirillum linum]|uniref:Pilus assembly protein PilZ n=2 Tax=Oceanospirillum linum TaxID=966 RepID=A0A1T1HEH4_OCELI|nr:pilus assembly protein PilZ [Oceanospirillum linum]SEF49741.1 type IV pilus assembly protein PilZ [Oleiphilus messinensis]SMP03618.1 type IV pilus assembly protein PilZ [Oceanospirillum linum]
MEQETGNNKARLKAAVVNLDKKEELYKAYMPFLHHGGLFLPTRSNFRLGQTLSLMLNLMDEPEKILVQAHVVWITPERAHGQRAAGIGVQFTEEHASLRDKIERYLSGQLDSERPTYTF